MKPCDSSEHKLNIYLGVATTNRRDVFGEVVQQIAHQVRQPDKIVVCAPSADDIPSESLARLRCPVIELMSGRGLCIQRNQILSNSQSADVVLFVDDDFLMAPDYLYELEKLFLQRPDVVMSTGHVEADGILGPGLTVEEGLQLLNSSTGKNAHKSSQIELVDSAYGCNMAIRLEAVRQINARFDENLPLYGWLEDVDFSGQIIHCGDVVRSFSLRGVHLGTKVGRSPGMRLGYSQVANPLYLAGKDTMSGKRARRRIARNIIANLVRLPYPEPWVDRRGRLQGNLKAIGDLILGRLSPKNILEIK